MLVSSMVKDNWHLIAGGWKKDKEWGEDVYKMQEKRKVERMYGCMHSLTAANH